MSDKTHDQAIQRMEEIMQSCAQHISQLKQEEKKADATESSSHSSSKSDDETSSKKVEPLGAQRLSKVRLILRGPVREDIGSLQLQSSVDGNVLVRRASSLASPWLPC